MIGNHNVLNSLAAISISLELKIPITTIKKTLSSFTGVQRRFQQIANINNTLIIDDYGHHPEEIKAVLSAAKLVEKNEKILAVFQPHRYSRLKNLFQEFCASFNDADKVILLNVYPAGEQKIINFENLDLEVGIRNFGHKNVLSLKNDEHIYNIIKEDLKFFDIIIFLGAGSFSQIAHQITEKILKIKEKN